MIEPAQMLREFKDCIGEVHASGVTTQSIHAPISEAARFAFSSIAHLIPDSVPIILESPVEESFIAEETAFASAAFSPWFNRLRTDIDDVLNVKIDLLRRQLAENFFKQLELTNISLRDYEAVICQLPTGGAFSSSDVLLNAREMLEKLSSDQKIQLREYLYRRIKDIAQEYPDLFSTYQKQLVSGG